MNSIVSVCITRVLIFKSNLTINVECKDRNSFSSLSKVRLSPHRAVLHGTHNLQYRFVEISHTNFHKNWTKNERNMGIISFTLISKERFSRQRISQKSNLLNGIKWKSFVPNFTRICQNVLEVLYHFVKYRSPLSYFQKIHTSSTICCN